MRTSDEYVGPFVMSEATLAYRRLVDRFGKRTEKLGHLHHRGKVRSVDDGKARSYELTCECGATFGPWPEV